MARTNARERILSSAAVVMVIALAAAVIVAVLDAEHNGRHALEQLQQAQINQGANQLDSELVAIVGPYSSAVNGTRPWNLTVADPLDAARLNQFQQTSAAARTGFLVINGEGVITNGTLLTDPHVVGQTLTRRGFSQFLASKAPFAVLPVAPGLTTTLPTIAFAVRITNTRTGAPGAFVSETDVAPDSIFNTVVASLRHGRTDVYSFIDSNGIVVASSDPSQLNQQAQPDLLEPKLGFHRHNGQVFATASVPHAGWRAGFRESTSEFEGKLTGPLRSALLLLIVVALVGAGLTFFALLARLRAAREEQQRLREISEAREEFISIVSHELRTPATGQLGFLQTALDHWDQLSEAERRDTVTQAYTNARRLHALTRDVLDTASIESGELPYAFEVFDLAPAVQAAVDAIPNRDRHPMNFAGGDTELRVRADPERIQQVLANVLDNAIKNSPTGSPIDVKVEAIGHDAQVEVSDRGAGMSEDELGRAFEKFSRGRHTTVQGTGLGLYICRKIMDAHRGRIWAGGREGGGATVTFALALVDDDREAAGPALPGATTNAPGAPAGGPAGGAAGGPAGGAAGGSAGDQGESRTEPTSPTTA